jgi:HD-like signal output (HDOD) protein
VSFFLICLAGLAAAVVLVLLFKKPRAGEAELVRSTMPSRPAAGVEPALPPLPPLPPMPPPAALLAFEWRPVDALPPARQQALLVELRRMPPPSRAFHQLVSPQFVVRASSAELSELVLAEPQVAAKVLARVNSSLYGLQTPVSSLGQAVTFLGLNSVRSLCLQSMLGGAFKADTPALQQRFDAIWLASALAGELCLRLALQLRLPDPGGMVTQLVLSFLGQFAAAARMPAQPVPGGPGLLPRTQAQQEQLGLGAPELGGLLMQEWALPAGLIAEVVAIDRVLVTPPQGLEEARAASLAVCYLSARLGERLARGEVVDLASFDPGADQDPDYFYLSAYLAQPRLARLAEALRQPELIRAVQAQLTERRPPG